MFNQPVFKRTAIWWILILFGLGGLALFLLMRNTPPDLARLAEEYRLGSKKSVLFERTYDWAGLPPRLEESYWAQQDPQSRMIPFQAPRQAALYAKKLAHRHQESSLFTWIEAGPDSLGGRTLAVALDKADPATVIAGASSGGIWKSTDRGTSWRIVTQPNEQFSVTSIAQDPRAENTNIWYMVGGEFRGSAGSIQNVSAGNYALGVYKSIDNGDSWTLLENAQAGSPSLFDSAFDYVSKVIVSPISGSVFLANNASGIYRSADGGVSFPRVLGALSQHTYNDVDIATDGTLIAVLSTLTLGGAQNGQGGVYLSRDDGESWENITPATFPSSHQRSMVAFAPSNPDVAYVLTNVGRPNPGSIAEDIRFHKLDLAAGTSEDRSMNLPDYDGFVAEGAQLSTLRNFTMALAVKPDDENYVIAGGVALYRSANGFATPLPSYAEAAIGGYECSTGECFDFVYATHYPEHWNDQHTVFFNPENPNEVWTANDGGVYRTDDVTQARVAWTNLNRGYNVAQFFNIHISAEAGDPRIIGGLQDHGVQYVQALTDHPTSGDDFSAGTRSAFSDGGYVFLGEKHALIGLANGRLHRLRYQNNDPNNLEDFFDYIRIFSALPPDLRPPGASGFKFYVHPFILDPVDSKTVFYPDGSTPSIGATLWRNPDINTGFSSNVLQRWERLDNFALPSGYLYTALAMSERPAHVLYMGASASFSAPAPPRIFRIEQATTTREAPVEVSIPNVPVGAFVHDIAVNPRDANEILVVFSNYNIVGLYHSSDGGQSYSEVEGNLAGPNGEGPSLRAASILPLNDIGSVQRVYLVATSTGLYSTRQLNGADTIWEPEAAEQLGGVVVDDVVSRPSDGRVVAGSHGRGLAVGIPQEVAVHTQDPVPLATNQLMANYPNPFFDLTTISFSIEFSSYVDLAIYDLNGKEVSHLLSDAFIEAGTHHFPFHRGDLASGLYLYRLKVASGTRRPLFTETKALTILK